MKKKVGIITFHAAHNYGSMLQAYAMQKMVSNLGFENELINLRIDVQKKMYQPAHQKGKTFLEKLSRKVFLGSYKKALKAKYGCFESFIHHYMDVSDKEYKTLEDLNEANMDYDFYISGSDQIWNTACPDFSWAYYLPFVNKGKRIAYAPSMGQRATEEFIERDLKLFKKYLSNYDCISVREDDTARIIEKVMKFSPQITLDPTLMLDAGLWENSIEEEPLLKGDYIFYYTPHYNKRILQIARALSKRLNLKIVTSIIHSSKFMVLYPDFEKEVAVGPLEFLNLCKNARLVCGKSYHLVVFALIFKVPFYAIHGMEVNRTKHLLELTNLRDRSISEHDFDEKGINAFDLDFSEVDKLLSEMRKESFNFLSNALK